MMKWNNNYLKKEKKIKLTEARRRAILWSEQEIQKKQLKAQFKIETISLSETSESATKVSRHSDLTTQTINKTTVSSLQKTIRDHKIQRQELDITIKVLSNYLNKLLNNPKFKGHKRTKTNGYARLTRWSLEKDIHSWAYSSQKSIIVFTPN